jgi:hypothetical protein
MLPSTVSFEHLQLLIAQVGILAFEIAGLLGIIVFLVKRVIREIKTDERRDLVLIRPKSSKANRRLR